LLIAHVVATLMGTHHLKGAACLALELRQQADGLGGDGEEHGTARLRRAASFLAHAAHQFAEQSIGGIASPLVLLRPPAPHFTGTAVG
jgi:hypothetical protein